jgi:hypothetical protein
MRGLLWAALTLAVGCGGSSSEGDEGQQPSAEAGAAGAAGTSSAAGSGSQAGSESVAGAGGSEAGSGSAGKATGGSTGGVAGASVGGGGASTGGSGSAGKAGANSGGSAGTSGQGGSGGSSAAGSGGAAAGSAGGGAAGAAGGGNGPGSTVLWEASPTIKVLVPDGADVSARVTLSGPLTGGGSCSAVVGSKKAQASAQAGTQTIDLDPTDVPCFTQLTCEHMLQVSWAPCANESCSVLGPAGVWESISPNCDGTGPDLAGYALTSLRLTVTAVDFEPFDSNSKIASLSQKWELLGVPKN